MNKKLRPYLQRFNAQSLRERGLVAVTLIALLGYGWWGFYAEPARQLIHKQQAENLRIGEQVDKTRAILLGVRQRLAAGVYLQKEQQLTRLREELAQVETRLHEETIELVDPEKMLQLMMQLIYSESKLKLLSLKRREVKPAIPRVEGETTGEPGIYRHVLEIDLAGKYVDVLKYMQTLEQLDWKLLWDEIDVLSEEHPTITLKLVMSTLSMRKEWIGI